MSRQSTRGYSVPQNINVTCMYTHTAYKHEVNLLRPFLEKDENKCTYRSGIWPTHFFTALDDG